MLPAVNGYTKVSPVSNVQWELQSSNLMLFECDKCGKLGILVAPVFHSKDQLALYAL